MNGGGGDNPSALDDPSWAGNTISIPLTPAAVAAGEPTDLSIIFDLDSVQISVDGGAQQTRLLTGRGTRNNWIGNQTTTIGARGPDGNNGGTNPTGGLFNESTLTSPEGVVIDAALWNASAPGSVVLDPEVIAVTLAINPAEGSLTTPPGSMFDGTTWNYSGTPAQVTYILGEAVFVPNGTAPVDVSVDIRDGLEDGTAPVTGTLTFDLFTTIDQWRFDNFGTGENAGSAANLSDASDTDTLVNLLEFAFGTDPNVADNAPLNPDGSVNGTPTTVASGGAGGVTFDALFVRRDDHGTHGSVTYLVEFSSDLVTFFPSTATPTLVVDSTDDPDYEVVSVPYPFLLPNGEKALFYRVRVELVP